MSGLNISHRKLLFAIIFGSVLLRLSAAFYLGNTVEPLPGTADQVTYHALAIRVLEGHGFSFDRNWWPLTKAGSPTAHWSFLYTFYLVAVYSLLGVQPLAARIIQSLVVGALQPLLAYLLGREVFGKKIGLVSAGITGGYIYFIYYSATLMTEPFYIVAVLYVFYLVVRIAAPEPGWKTSVWKQGVALGLALAAAVLLRQLFLLLVPGILLWVWWRSGCARGKTLLFAGAILAIMIVPFTVYNYLRFQQFVLLNTNAGFAFFWANHPIYGTRFVPILTPEMGTYAGLIPADLRNLSEAALDRDLLKLGIGFVVSDPWRYLVLSVSRIPVFFEFWPTKASGLVSNVSRVMSFGLFAPFMVIGTVRSLWPKGNIWRVHSRDGVAVLLLFSIGYSAIHIFSWSLVRYRLPVDAIMVLFAGFALVHLLELLARILRRSTPERARVANPN